MAGYSVKQLLRDVALQGQTVTVRGWVRTRRDSKVGISFIHISDGSCFDPIQVVVPEALDNYRTDVLKLTTGCAVEISGECVASPAKGQSQEISASCVKVIGWVANPDTYPISPKHHTLEYLRDVAHLRPRTNTIGAMTRIRHCLSQAVHQYLSNQGFKWIHTPIITSSDCEGAGELFRVSTLDLANLPYTEQGAIDFSQDFFGNETFLTVSGQLNVESYCLAMSKVYTFGPTFRAENSNTSRHLAEFWMIEPEIAFANLDDIIDLAEKTLQTVCQQVLAECADDLEFFAKRVDKTCIQRLENLLSQPFIRLDYTEAIEILKKSDDKFEYPVKWGMDLQSEHERYLTEKWAKQPIVVKNYPADIKAFYMRLNPDNQTVAAMDVLVPGIGEIIGGSQREERYDVLAQRLHDQGIDTKHMQWYLDLRQYGSVPHAGFGLGLERLISYVTGLANVRDVIPFPRTPKHAGY